MPAELIETAARIFRAEAQDGYRDRVVIGGLSGFVANLHQSSPSADVDRVAELLRDYAQLPESERALRLQEAARVLNGSKPPLPLGEAARSAGEGCVSSRTFESRTHPSPPPSPRGRGGSTSGVTLATPIQSLSGIGATRALPFSRLGIRTVRDLLFHFPTRLEEFRPPTPVSELFFQTEGSVVGTLQRLEVENLPAGLKKHRATIKDRTGTIYAEWLRRGVWRLGIRPGEAIAISGTISQEARGLVFKNPEYESGDSPPLHTRGLVPIHPLTAKLTGRELRRRIHWAVTHFASRVTDPLPESIRAEHDLLPIDQALRQIQFPRSPEEYAAARRRFALEELLMIQLVVIRRRMAWQHDPAVALPRQSHVLDALIGALPFELTAAQRRVTDEILRDMALERPMTRLLQGEVGSGKTAVATLALLDALANRLQGAFMAPTEILAEQHFATLSRLFGSAGSQLENALGRQPTLRLLTGSVKGKDRARAYADAASGALDILVGTQALIQDRLEFAQLGLVIVDEQHRFGVRQRVTLRQRASGDSPVPHLLVMTATPIPRTLALSLYGDLDLSTIDEMPPGRQLPRTRLLGPNDRDVAYERVRRAAADGEQSFIICPLVEESEALEAKAATEEYERLRSGELASLRLGLLHGRMRPAAKDAVMRAFRDHEFDVLVSTAVVEVGVDVPNATVMLIEGAERFGLAQLHQFRGRIGRGGQPSVCILLTDLPDPEANERLRVVAQTTNGLALAEHDLRLRGPGDYFGVRQSGLPELKVARLDDAPIVEAARSAATSVLTRDPDLVEPEHAALRAHLLDFVARSTDPS